MKTIRVRIAVAVEPNGEPRWCASGWSGAADNNMRDDVAQMGECPYGSNGGSPVWHYIEADVPLPEPVPSQTVEGKVAQ